MKCSDYAFFVFVLAKSSWAVFSNENGTRDLQAHSGNSCLLTSFVPTWIPLHYKLFFTLDPAGRRFSGKVSIRGKMKSFSSVIELHSVNLTVETVSIQKRPITFHHIANEVLVLKPDPPLRSNQKFTLVITYKGPMYEDHGIITTNYTANRSITFTYLEPIAARTVFPCVDLPQYKATFDISIEKLSSEFPTILSNMPAKEADAQQKSVQFERTPLMPTYLVSFLVADYVPIDGGNNVTIWVPPETSSNFHSALNMSSVFLKALERYTNSTYPLPKLDQFVIPQFHEFDGMENWGLIMYNQKVLRGQLNSSTLAHTSRKLHVIAHELAHNWFGNLVTIENWCSVWLQEALPTFLHGIIPQQVFPDLEMVNAVKSQTRGMIMVDECLGPARPLQVHPKQENGGENLFVHSAYYKGASILYMAEAAVTPPVFQQGLQELIRKHQYSSVSVNQFWDEIQIAANRNGISLPASAGNIAQTWTSSTSHPVVSVFRNSTNGLLTASQELCVGESGTWWIPISYTTSSSRNFNDTKPLLWLPPVSGTQSLNVTLRRDEWIILNLQATGFYRVNYDEVTWKLLTNQLMTDHEAIHFVNRAVLIDDSFNLAFIQRLNYSVPLSLMQYLKNERKAYVWEMASGSIKSVLDLLVEYERSLFQKYVQSLIAPAFAELASNHFANPTIENRLLWREIYSIALNVQYPESWKYSVEVANMVIDGRLKNTQIPVDVQNDVWCQAIANGQTAIFDFKLTEYEMEKDPEAKQELLKNQLFCSKRHTRQLLSILQQRTPENSPLADSFFFIIDHWVGECKEILQYFQSNETRNLLAQLQQNVRSDENWRGWTMAALIGPPAECIDEAGNVFDLDEIDLDKIVAKLETASEVEESRRPEIFDWLNSYSFRSTTTADPAGIFLALPLLILIVISVCICLRRRAESLAPY